MLGQEPMLYRMVRTWVQVAYPLLCIKLNLKRLLKKYLQAFNNNIVLQNKNYFGKYKTL